VAAGKTGKKAGEGFFRWEGDKAVGDGPRAAALAKKR
jgi:3-hydroxyacyl-CoA dehydrogenase